MSKTPVSEARQLLIDAVMAEMKRVWGEDGLGGQPQEYEWLKRHYGIAEDEDVSWQLILEHSIGEQLPEDRDDPEVISLVNDETRVLSFLRDFLQKYQSSAAVYRGV
jgi:predicted 3-demethylubiquinone-9 3-methyltransferase (glyoxalase superfamily)